MNTAKIFKWVGTGIAAIFAIVVLGLVSLEFFINDSYVARTVTKIAEKSLNAQLSVKEVNFTAFSHFPHVGVKLIDGSIVSRTHLKDSVHYSRTPAQADSLVSFKEFTLLFSPLKLIAGRVQIQGIILDSPRAYAYVSPTGAANWDIVASDTTQMAAAEDTLQESLPLKINIRNISILGGGRFVFDNRADGLRASASMKEVKLSGNFTDDLTRIRVRKGNFSHLNMALFQMANRASVRFSIDTLNVQAAGKGCLAVEAKTRTNVRVARSSMAENVPLDVQGKITLGSRREKAVTLEDFKVSIASVPLSLEGKIEYSADSLHTDALYANIEEFPLESLLKYVPKAILPDINKLETNTRLSVESKIYGSYSFTTGKLPSADVKFNIPSSSISVEGRKEKIKELAFKGNAFYRPQNPDSTMVTVERLLVDGDGIAVDGKGSVKDLEGDPYLNVDVSSRISIDSLIKMLPQGTDIYGKGLIAGKVNLKSRLSNLSLYNLAKTNVSGDITAENVEMGIPSQEIFCNIYGGEMRVGSWANTIDSAVNKGTKMIGVHLKVDSTYIRYADSLLVKGRSITLSGSNEASLFDTTSKVVHPFNGKISAKSFSLLGADSVSMRVTDAYGNFRILPYKGDFSIPSMQLTANCKRISLREQLHFAMVSDAALSVESHRNDTELKMREQRLASLTDSLQVIYPQVQRDSLLRHWFRERRGTRTSASTRLPDDFAQEDYNFRLADKGIVSILNRWESQGSLNARAIRVSTPAFPLRSKAEEIAVSFNLNELTVDKIALKSGQSQFKAKGKISGIKGALTRGSRIKAQLSIDADTLNFNELAKAANAGTEYMNQSGTLPDSLQQIADADALENAIALEGSDTVGKMSLIIVPKNIEAELDMNVKYGIYSSMVLHSAKGKVSAKDRCLQITDFNATTSAGALDLEAFYKTRSRTDLSVGFDMQLTDINVAEFIKLYPQVDSLLPMIKSFEGIINSQMAATAQIDTNMNFLLSTVEGVARIKGDSLVLMDGETFAEIAKMMKFKNRERNLVDSISVELAIKDNTIEVYPFIMKMDRYTTAISGKQDMDMNLDYHISVIKSPVPMRLGIDITGNIDDFKIRLGKVRYKNANLPVYTKQIDSTRINLREQIRNIYN